MPLPAHCEVKGLRSAVVPTPFLAIANGKQGAKQVAVNPIDRHLLSLVRDNNRTQTERNWLLRVHVSPSFL